MSEEKEVSALLEPGFFSPKKDPAGANSSVLVAFMGGGGLEDSNSWVEVLAHFGAGIRRVFEEDEYTYRDEWADSFEEEDCHDGLFVLEGRWQGSGEESEFLISTIRLLSDGERLQISQDESFESIVHVWALGWEEAECTWCSQPLMAHEGFLLPCPEAH